MRAPPGTFGYSLRFVLGAMAPTLAFACFVVGTLVFASARSTKRSVRGALAVDDRGVFVDGTCVLPRRADGAPVSCELDRGGRLWISGEPDIGITLHPGADLRGLVVALRRALRARPSFRGYASRYAQRSTGMHLALTLACLVGMILGIVSGSVHGVGSAVGGAILGVACGVPLAMILWAVGFVLLRVKMTIGADGIELRRWLRRTRIISFADVASVEAWGPDIVISFRDGRPIFEMGFGVDEGPQYLTTTQAAAVATVVSKAAFAFRRTASMGGNTYALLARNGRSVADWVLALRAARDEHASFRSVTVQDAELWAIAEDPSAPDGARVGAALALRAALEDEAARARMRCAADACITPKLRVALEAVADPAEDEHTLEQSLASIDDAPEPAALRAAHPRS